MQANVPNETRYLGQSCGGFGNGTEEPDRKAQLLRHDANRFNQVSVVREYSGNVETSLTRIVDKMTGQIHVASLFLCFPNLSNDRIRWNERRQCASSHLRRMYQASPGLRNQKVAHMHGDFRDGLQGIQINLLTSRSGRIEPS